MGRGRRARGGRLARAVGVGVGIRDPTRRPRGGRATPVARHRPGNPGGVDHQRRQEKVPGCPLPRAGGRGCPLHARGHRRHGADGDRGHRVPPPVGEQLGEGRGYLLAAVSLPRQLDPDLPLSPHG